MHEHILRTGIPTTNKSYTGDEDNQELLQGFLVT
jgi:hypothetical protein